MERRKVRFPSGKLSLEGVLGIPDGAGPFPAVVVCHPHPLYGGSMDNNVVYAVFKALFGASFVTLKFNFRGVGSSEGKFSDGKGEQEDVSAAIDFVGGVKPVDVSRIGLAGYSAGAAFAFPVGVKDARVKALAAISPPLTMFDFEAIKSSPKPKILIIGNQDDLIPVERFREVCHDMAAPEECVVISGADHFWQGLEAGLADKVVAFFTSSLVPEAA